MPSIYRNLKNKVKEKKRVPPPPQQQVSEPSPEVEKLDDEVLLQMVTPTVVVESKVEAEEPKPVEVAPPAPVVISDKEFTANGCFFNQKEKRFYNVTIAYNPTTQETRFVSKEVIADGIPAAIFKMNKITGDKLMKRKEVL